LFHRRELIGLPPNDNRFLCIRDRRPEAVAKEKRALDIPPEFATRAFFGAIGGAWIGRFTPGARFELSRPANSEAGSSEEAELAQNEFKLPENQGSETNLWSHFRPAGLKIGHSGDGRPVTKPEEATPQGMRVKLSVKIPCFREIRALFAFVIATISGQRLFQGAGLRGITRLGTNHPFQSGHAR
jgi:hypothetical protein